MDTIKGKNYYEVFGLTPDASNEQIKQVYRQLAQVYHPDSPFHEDIVKDSIEENELDGFFKQLTAAYNVLIDPNQRKQYDAEIAEVQHMKAAPCPAKLTKAEQITGRYKSSANSIDRYHAYKTYREKVSREVDDVPLQDFAELIRPKDSILRRFGRIFGLGRSSSTLHRKRK